MLGNYQVRTLAEAGQIGDTSAVCEAHKGETTHQTVPLTKGHTKGLIMQYG